MAAGCGAVQRDVWFLAIDYALQIHPLTGTHSLHLWIVIYVFSLVVKVLYVPLKWVAHTAI